MRLRTAPVLFAIMLVAPTAAVAAPVGHVRVAIDSNAAFPSYEQTAQRNDVVILQAWQQDRMHALKAARPGVKVLVYKNLAFGNRDTGPAGLASSGVTYAEADSAHPDWFLLNKSGQRFTSWSYDYLWAMDVGSAGYQERWADNVIAELREQGWDGVFMDDVNTTMKYHYDVASVAKYPSDAAYAAATRSALAAIGPRVRAAGKLAVANIGSWPEYPSVGNDWLQFLDGAMDEMFLKWGTSAGQGYGWLGRWEQQLKSLKEAERQGKLFLAVTHSAAGDVDAARYGYATMLLGSSGSGLFALAQDYSNETWFPEYDYDLGNPTAGESADPTGVHRRPFERGLVLVNPTDAAKAVDFGGAYSGSGLSAATGATLAPNRALVLTRDGAAQRPQPSRASRPRHARRPITLLGTVDGAGHVALRWAGGGARARRFRIRRNGRLLALVRGKRLRDARTRPGRRYRYSVAALGPRGRTLQRSGSVRVRTPKRSRRRARGSAAGYTIRAAFAARDRGAWSQAFVARRERAGGRRSWQRVSRLVRPSASMRFRVHLPRAARVRIVVRSTAGPALRSGPLRLTGVAHARR